MSDRGASPQPLSARYRDLVARGEIDADPAQLEAIERLEAVAAGLKAWRPAGTGLLARFRRSGPSAPRGLYVHGEVGRGKTMLMDLFFDSVGFEPKRRIHFHEFMAEVHDRIGEARKATPGDPIPGIAKDIATSARLFCFDEMHVTDIADAMILGRLFAGLFDAGVTVVATSNSHPRDLYKNGLNRQLFLPFVDRIVEHMAVVELVAAKDYRLERLAGQQLYFSPADRAAAVAVENLWQRLTGGHPAEPTDLAVKGRKVHVPAAAMGVARFQFPDLCEKPLGPLDYLHVAHAFHTLVIENVPILRPNRRDIARRFINLIDTLYDNRVGLIISADAEPHQLYAAGDGADLFQRTASRLIDMRSEAYQAERGQRADVAPDDAATDVATTPAS